MPDPTPYEPGYDFTASDKGVQLNVELADVAEATEQLVLALQDVRRSDGALKNGIVTADSLAPSALAALGPNGDLTAEALAEAEASADEAAASATTAALYGRPFASRAAFQAATIPEGVTRSAYFANPLGAINPWALAVCLSDVPGCAATNGGTKFWQPDGTVHPNHFADNASPGTTNMAPAWQAAIDWATSVVGTGAGVAQRPSAIVRGLPQNYRINSTIKISGGQDAVKLWGDGARMISAVSGPCIRVGDDIMFSGGDTAGMNSNFQSRITGFTFTVATGNTTDTIAIQGGSCPGLTIDHNVFFDFWCAIDGHRFNGRSICDNFFYINTRSTQAAAFIRLQGVYDSTNNYTPGGGIHVERNEFIGPAEDRTKLQDCIHIQSVDGFYHASNHYVHYARAAIAIEPDGTTRNNVIYDVISHGGNYFDDPAALARNVLITGTLTHSGAGGMANGNMANIKFTAGDYFRGGGEASFGILVDVIDGGGFVAARGGIKGFSVTGCTFSQHRVCAVFAHGVNHMSNRVPLLTPTVHDSQFSQGKLGGTTTGTSYISLDSDGADVQGNTFERESVQATRAVLLTQSTYTAPNITFAHNDMGKCDVTAQAYQVTKPVDARWIIGPNITPSGVIDENDGKPKTAFAAHRNNADQTGIVTATATKVVANSEVFDQGAYYDSTNARWTPPAGRYQVTAAALFTAAVVDGEQFRAMLYVNGALARQSIVTASGTASLTVSVTATLVLDGDDYVEFFVRGDGTGDKTISGAPANTWFEGAAL